jgi:hypothetical protein
MHLRPRLLTDEEPAKRVRFREGKKASSTLASMRLCRTLRPMSFCRFVDAYEGSVQTE